MGREEETQVPGWAPPVPEAVGWELKGGMDPSELGPTCSSSQGGGGEPEVVAPGGVFK